MLNRESIRPERYYWVMKRKPTGSADVTLAYMHGELPSLSMRVLTEAAYSTALPSDYNFLGEADMQELFDATFKGTTLEELLRANQPAAT